MIKQGSTAPRSLSTARLVAGLVRLDPGRESVQWTWAMRSLGVSTAVLAEAALAGALAGVLVVEMGPSKTRPCRALRWLDCGATTALLQSTAPGVFVPAVGV